MPPYKFGQCPVTPPNISIFDAQFVYRPNFEGRQETFNDEGDRYFNVLIPDNIVEQIIADGWNVAWTKPSKSATPQQIEEHVSEPFLKVALGFKYRPPTIVLRENGIERELNEANCGLVDGLEFESMDVVIRGRPWENERSQECGIKAWLQTFVGNVMVDDVLAKYAKMREEV